MFEWTKIDGRLAGFGVFLFLLFAFFLTIPSFKEAGFNKEEVEALIIIGFLLGVAFCFCVNYRSARLKSYGKIIPWEELSPGDYRVAEGYSLAENKHEQIIRITVMGIHPSLTPDWRWVRVPVAVKFVETVEGPVLRIKQVPKKTIPEEKVIAT